MTGKVVGVLTLMLALTAGCAQAEQNTGLGTTQVEEQYPASQAWALADGSVSEVEYRKAINGFVTCVKEAGYKVTEPILSPVDGLTLLYDLPTEGEPTAWNTAMENCNTANISHIEAKYVESRVQVMDEKLRVETAKCLQGKGFSPTGAERNVRDFQNTAARSGAVMECVITALRQHFPAVPGFLKVRW